MSTVRINDGNGSYICENGHLHSYNSRSLKEILKDTDGKIYNNVNELKKAMEDE